MSEFEQRYGKTVVYLFTGQRENCDMLQSE